ncbi:hypothetical protein BLNAU_2349 [Blattamonas nauphoetae]|uniref:MRG domain-containing protein n=1 Tax=Blattamonas nauphoetae TaxID=2049346 RepID=A0ABQ9YFG8_9EUKA|nr:hypothetical protein BLNAU_2349 [Blattamonas nauphoetae]
MIFTQGYFYPGRILKTRVVDGKAEYYIHFLGFSASYDEWIAHGLKGQTIHRITKASIPGFIQHDESEDENIDVDDPYLKMKAEIEEPLIRKNVSFFLVLSVQKASLYVSVPLNLELFLHAPRSSQTGFQKILNLPSTPNIHCILFAAADYFRRKEQPDNQNLTQTLLKHIPNLLKQVLRNEQEIMQYEYFRLCVEFTHQSHTLNQISQSISSETTTNLVMPQCPQFSSLCDIYGAHSLLRIISILPDFLASYPDFFGYHEKKLLRPFLEAIVEFCLEFEDDLFHDDYVESELELPKYREFITSYNPCFLDDTVPVIHMNPDLSHSAIQDT